MPELPDFSEIDLDKVEAFVNDFKLENYLTEDMLPVLGIVAVIFLFLARRFIARMLFRYVVIGVVMGCVSLAVRMFLAQNSMGTIQQFITKFGMG